jgi:hypothetical protein
MRLLLLLPLRDCRPACNHHHNNSREDRHQCLIKMEEDRNSTTNTTLTENANVNATTPQLRLLPRPPQQPLRQRIAMTNRVSSSSSSFKTNQKNSSLPSFTVVRP